MGRFLNILPLLQDSSSSRDTSLIHGGHARSSEEGEGEEEEEEKEGEDSDIGSINTF
jgi:hypothetical protein